MTRPKWNPSARARREALSPARTASSSFPRCASTSARDAVPRPQRGSSPCVRAPSFPARGRVPSASSLPGAPPPRASRGGQSPPITERDGPFVLLLELAPRLVDLVRSEEGHSMDHARTQSPRRPLIERPLELHSPSQSSPSAPGSPNARRALRPRGPAATPRPTGSATPRARRGRRGSASAARDLLPSRRGPPRAALLSGRCHSWQTREWPAPVRAPPRRSCATNSSSSSRDRGASPTAMRNPAVSRIRRVRSSARSAAVRRTACSASSAATSRCPRFAASSAVASRVEAMPSSASSAPRARCSACSSRSVTSVAKSLCTSRLSASEASP